jgi:hypothetical protein
VFLFSWKLFGLFLYAKFVVNYVLAYVLGIAFQYYSIKPIKGLSPRGCYGLGPSTVIARCRKRQAKATKCSPATVSGNRS